jgi:predicted GNAT superfamily acetyltransferase
MQTDTPTSRDAITSDFESILALNEESVHFLSPISTGRLAKLHADAAYHRVVEVDGEVAAFLLAFAPGSDYNSLNYRWFAERYERFLYIDRVVVASKWQGQGLGTVLYRDLFKFARETNAQRVTCEFDIDPPNEASRRFHERWGFAEVGGQVVAGGKKTVSMQAAELVD